jgi:hypothetical protein
MLHQKKKQIVSIDNNSNKEWTIIEKSAWEKGANCRKDKQSSAVNGDDLSQRKKSHCSKRGRLAPKEEKSLR